MKLVFLLTGAAIVTYWFYLKLLNPFIDAAIAIVKCALVVILTFFFKCVGIVYAMLAKTIGDPIRKVTQRIHIRIHIHIPLAMKIFVYFMVGVGFFVLDHFYGTKIYEADETTFYHVVFQGTTYWITQQGLVIGGFFVVLATLITIGEIWSAIDNLLSRPIRISVVIQK